jgi:TrpR-related protein YerC/YecD
MIKNTNWLNNNSKQLFKALSRIGNEKDMANFCRDLMTENEIEALSGRWQVALLLSNGTPQRDVSIKTGVSIATVTRVNRWLNRGMGGYRKVISMKKTSRNLHSHTKAD